MVRQDKTKLKIDTFWGTTAEVEFLQALGTHRLKGRGIELKGNKLELLKKYKDTMPLRVRWGDIDGEVVKGQVEMMIEGEVMKNGYETKGKTEV